METDEANPGGRRHATVTALGDVEALVDLIVRAQTRRPLPHAPGETRYWLTFWFADGTTLGRPYYPESSELMGGVVVGGGLHPAARGPSRDDRASRLALTDGGAWANVSAAKETAMDKWNVGILIFDGVEVLDFAGPFEVFSRTRLEPGAASRRSDDTAPFHVFTVARTKDAVSATGGPPRDAAPLASPTRPGSTSWWSPAASAPGL